MSPTSNATRQRAEQLAAALPPLLVAAERVASTVDQGVHGRRRVGQGETFWQFRRYQPGDSPQKIDWRQSAKTQPVFIRETEWAAAQSVWLWRDASPSMRYRSSDTLPEKIERAELLMLALAALLVRGGERIALLGTGQPPTAGRTALNRMALQIARAEQTAAGSTATDLPTFELLPRHGQVVFISDFLAPLPEIDRVIRRFAERGVRGHLLQVLDPAEETLPFAGRVRFEGLEGEGDLLMSRVESVREDYINRMRIQYEGLAAMTRAAGWSLSSHRTDRAPQSALLALFLLLSETVGPRR